MSVPSSLYEPKLVDRWSKRYRAFETDEMVRRLRTARRNQNRLRLEQPDTPKPTRSREVA